jgi:prevent-host-death family protein
MGTQIGLFEVKTHLSAVIERVRRGERFTITRRGEPVAELAPVSTVADLEMRRRALARVDAHRKRLRSTGVKISVEDIRSAIEEGRY